MATLFDMNLKAAPGGYEIQEWGLQKLATDPVTNLFVGRFYLNTASNRIRTYNGTTWDEYSTSVGTGDVSQASNSAGAGRVKVSAGANKTIQDSTITSALLKMDASSVLAAAVVGTDYVTGASTNTFTNKTFDANGTGNSISNIEVADLAAGVLNTSSTLSGATGSQLPSALAVSQAIASAVAAVAKPMGGIDCSTNPNYPAANVGEFYRVTVAGLIGGASGIAVQVGDQIHCYVTSAAGNQATVGANWTVVQSDVDQATTAVLGLTRYATQAESEAQSLSNVAVTPAALVNYPIIQNISFGDGTATSFTIAHGRGSANVTADVYDNATNSKRYPDIVVNSTNVIISGYLTAPTSNQFRVIILG